MKRILLLSFMLFTFSLLQAQNFEWVKQLRGTSSTQVQCIAHDGVGNIIIAFNFQGDIDADPGTSNYPLTSSSINDSWLLKMDPMGNLIWIKQIEGYSIISSIHVDDYGFIELTGLANYNTDFDPGLNTHYGTSDYTGIFILKLTSNGEFNWVRCIGKNIYDAGVSITSDQEGNLYTVGYFIEDTLDMDPGIDTFNLFSKGNLDAFVLKLDSSGEFKWAQSFGDTALDLAINIAYDANGFLVIGGYFNGQIDFDFSDTGSHIVTCPSSHVQDVFLLKLDTAGVFKWVQTFGGIGYDDMSVIKIDNHSRIYLTGAFQDTVDFNPDSLSTLKEISNGQHDIYIASYESNGNFSWVKHIGGKKSEFVRSFDMDDHGNLWLTGQFQDTIDFDPGMNTHNLSAHTGSDDIFIAKFDSSGNYLWSTSFGNPYVDIGVGVSINQDNQPYFVGNFSGTIDFNTGSAIDTLSKGGVYILKLGEFPESVSTQYEGQSIYIFPNPVYNQLNVEIPQSIVGSTFRIVDIFGRVILSGILKNSKSTIATSSLHSGTYFMQIDNTEKSSFKLLKD